jgi:hypothetical protein
MRFSNEGLTEAPKCTTEALKCPAKAPVCAHKYSPHPAYAGQDNPTLDNPTTHAADPRAMLHHPTTPCQNTNI